MAKTNTAQNLVDYGTIKDSKGRFKKGQSGNPGGIPKEKRSIIELCRSMSEDVLNVIYNIAMDENEKGSTRIIAGQELLNRGWGKPGIRKQEGEQEQYIPQQMIINMSKEDYEEYLKEREEQNDVV